MTTPVKYRDRVYAAIVQYMGRLKRTARQRRDAYEDLMAVIDAVIEEVSAPTGDSLTVHVPDATRGKIIEALATMDDEAFSWLVRAMPPSAMLHGARCQIWPDGLGGFRDRATIDALRTAAQAWIEANHT
jgi:hypothetical protein